ncbi:hypothetical protein MNBD_CHLOROFLEXI01-4492 [hydrothermal vent metagenome]|uniref:DUF86 domain-containing protein n=1 Tax=hydrothermal vent metagenome TaxID=652676 RepID=A0A3B0URB2_9ZZZZ
MNDDFLDYIEDILDAMNKAEILLEGVSYEQFAADFRINFAVVRALEIVGEATKRLPMSLRDSYPEIPWRNMAGMRDRITHGYDSINLRIVWDVVKVDNPELKPQIRKILEDYSDE